jgi:hypothetical protein
MTQTCTGRHEPCVLHTATLIDGLDELGHEMRYALMAIVSDAYVTRPTRPPALPRAHQRRPLPLDLRDLPTVTGGPLMQLPVPDVPPRLS